MRACAYARVIDWALINKSIRSISEDGLRKEIKEVDLAPSSIVGLVLRVRAVASRLKKAPVAVSCCAGQRLTLVMNGLTVTRSLSHGGSGPRCLNVSCLILQ